MDNSNNLPPIEPYTLDPVPAGGYDPEPAAYYEESFTDEDYDRPRRNKWVVLGIVGLIVAGALSLTGLLLTSGGNKTPTNNNNNGNQNGQLLELQWWGAFLDSDVVQPLIEEYQTLNTNIKITYANKWDNTINYKLAVDQYQTQLNNELVNNPRLAPDIYMVDGNWVGDYESFLYPSPTMTSTQFKDTYYPATVSNFTLGNAVLGLPVWMDTLAIVYNKDILQQNSTSEPPTNWTQFRNLAVTLTKKDRGTVILSGFAAGTPINTTFSYELINLLMVQNRVLITDAQRQVVFGSSTNAKAAFDFYKSFIGTTNQTWSASNKNDAAEFLEQDLAMTVSTAWRYRDLLKFNEQKALNIDIGVGEMPQLEGQIDPETNQAASFMNWGNSWGNLVNRNSINAQESWKFITWLNEPAQQRKLSENVKAKYGYFGLLYARKDMSQELENDAYLKIFNRSLPFTKSWYMVKGQEVKELFEEELTQPAVDTSSITTLQEDVKKLIAKKGQLKTE